MFLRYMRININVLKKKIVFYIRVLLFFKMYIDVVVVEK